MILAYGSYRHALGEANLTIQRDTILSPANLAIGWRERWHIQGRLQAATVEQLSSAIIAIENAYRVSQQDAVLYLPDGVTRTAHQLLNSKTYGGVRVTRPPSFPAGDGAEYSTFRT